jgi:hypothetical protein
MKKLYSALSSIALLLSMPAVAAPMAAKSVEPKANGKESQSKSVGDKVHAEKAQPKEASSPICRGGGG